MIAEGVQPPMLNCPTCEAPGCTTTIATKVPFRPGLSDNIWACGSSTANTGHAEGSAGSAGPPRRLGLRQGFCFTPMGVSLGRPAVAAPVVARRRR